MAIFAANTQSRTDAESMFSALVKKWRKIRKVSQLDLALDAGISQRHLSFLESGRARPSREMVLCLAETLALPLRERNLLLTAAGFAALFKERNLDTEEMRAVHNALRLSLDHHQPYPAVVADRNWNLVMQNDAAIKLIQMLGEPEQVWQAVDSSGDHNLYRMTFHPSGLQPLIGNWDTLARLLLLRLQREVAADPTNDYLRNLLVDITQLSGIEGSNSLAQISQPLTPIVSMELRVGAYVLKVFSMVSSFGTALDITAEELRIETFFPADEFTGQFFKQLNPKDKDRKDKSYIP